MWVLPGLLSVFVYLATFTQTKCNELRCLCRRNLERTMQWARLMTRIVAQGKCFTQCVPTYEG